MHCTFWLEKVSACPDESDEELSLDSDEQLSLDLDEELSLDSDEELSLELLWALCST